MLRGNATVTIRKTMLITTAMRSTVAAITFMESYRFAPQYWLEITLAPLPMPMKMKRKMVKNCVDRETPEMAVCPRRPIMMLSRKLTPTLMRDCSMTGTMICSVFL